MRKEDVDNYTPRRVLVPCQVRVRWVGDRDDPEPLSHEIKLVGATNVFDFLTVTSPIRFIGMFTIQLFGFNSYCLILVTIIVFSYASPVPSFTSNFITFG